jgi:hypothetical protein
VPPQRRAKVCSQLPWPPAWVVEKLVLSRSCGVALVRVVEAAP